MKIKMGKRTPLFFILRLILPGLRDAKILWNGILNTMKESEKMTFLSEEEDFLKIALTNVAHNK